VSYTTRSLQVTFSDFYFQNGEPGMTAGRSDLRGFRKHERVRREMRGVGSSHWPYATSVCGLKLLVCEALSW
jgi:hypothetical protein